jgi:hypothetical protein
MVSSSGYYTLGHPLDAGIRMTICPHASCRFQLEHADLSGSMIAFANVNDSNRAVGLAQSETHGIGGSIRRQVRACARVPQIAEVTKLVVRANVAGHGAAATPSVA